MKAFMPGTDRKVEFNIFVNGSETPLQEFEVNFVPQDSNIVECYVAVTPGDEVMIRGSFEGTIMYGAFDLICDGSFAADKRLERQDAEPTRRWRQFEWRRVLHSPKPADWTSIESHKDASEGNLCVKTLGEDVINDLSRYETYIKDEPMPGVGSIEVVVSLSTHEMDRYFNKEWGCYIGAWKDGGLHTVRDPQILPDHELGIEITEQEVSRKRSLRFLRHWKNTRFGVEPWARFIFYYRDIAAITQAGAVPVDQRKSKRLASNRSDVYSIHETLYAKKSMQNPIRPDEEDDLIRNSDGTLLSSRPAPLQKLPEVRTTTKKRPANSLGASDTYWHESSPDVNAMEAAQDTSNTQTDSEAPVKKMKRLGGTLKLPNNIDLPTLNEWKSHNGNGGIATLPGDLEAHQVRASERHIATTQEQNTGIKLMDSPLDLDEADKNTPLEQPAQNGSEDLFDPFDGALGLDSADEIDEPVIPERALGSDFATSQNDGLAPISPPFHPINPQFSGYSIIPPEGPPDATTHQQDSSTSPLIDYLSESPRGLLSNTMTEPPPEQAREAGLEWDVQMHGIGNEAHALSHSQTRQRGESLSKFSAHANTAIANTSAQVSEPWRQIKADFDRLPSLEDISAKVGPNGIDRWSLLRMFEHDSPYQNSTTAQAEFDSRVSQVAEANTTDGRFYLNQIPKAPASQLAYEPTTNRIARTASTALSVPSPPRIEQGYYSMDPIQKNNMAAQGSGTPRKRQGPSRDTSSAPPAQRQRTQTQAASPAASASASANASANASATSPTPSTNAATSLAAKMAEMKRRIAEKEKYRAEQDSQIAALTKKIEEERRAKEEEERRVREAAEAEERRAQEEFEELARREAELDEDVEDGDEMIRQLQEGNSEEGLFGDEFEDEQFDGDDGNALEEYAEQDEAPRN